ncbi:hypothetical protein [Enteractinococcus coprophilus]|uniref:hypothetical protein n=1 Tax=Enteractinococcus coprophilus TaxID=1027633 RepID=UPI00114D7AD6|nr:hypothetical protein [Enteractinococcus coprophilus]
MEYVVPFASLNSVKDLQSFVTRAKTLDTTGVRFVVSGQVLAASVSVMHPAGLGDGVPIVIGLRTFALDFAGQPRFELDSVFEMDAITDRSHRMISENSTAFPLPPREIAVSWTAMNAPRSGWTTAAVVEDADIRKIARDGISKVSEGLPDNPGAPLLAQVRSAVWGEQIGDPSHVEFPAGATLGAHSLGFLLPRGETTVSRAGNWVRLTSTGGHILARRAVAL